MPSNIRESGGPVVVDSLFIAAPIVCWGSVHVFGPSFVLCLSSIAIILAGNFTIYTKTNC